MIDLPKAAYHGARGAVTISDVIFGQGRVLAAVCFVTMVRDGAARLLTMRVLVEAIQKETSS